MSPRAERAAKHQTLGVLRDVDEAADARESARERAHVDAAFRVHLHRAEYGSVEAAPVVKIKLRRLVHDGLRIMAATKAQPGRGYAARRPALHSERKLTELSPLRRDGGNRFGQADAQVDDVALAYLHEGAAADDLALRKWQWSKRAVPIGTP